MKRFIAKHSPLFILAALCVAMAFYSESFRTTENFQSVAYRTAVIGIIATGQLAVILTAGIDLSVGSVAALAGVVGCIAMKEYNIPVPLGILLGMLTGLACGLINGALCTKGRIPPFIVTLGMMMVARGLALLLTGGEPIFGLPAGFAWLGGTETWWTPVLITVALAVTFAITLNFTRFGRSLYAIGGNRQAARLSGIPVDRVRVGAFALCGALAGTAGMVLASRTSIASPNAAEMSELDAIAACVIGGASLMGGEGGAIASLAGALIMMVLRNFCNLENIEVYWQQVIVGSLIVALVFYDNHRKRKAGLLNDD
ncbi:MAG: ABC transporter permease [Candidatus Hydrogenedentes bacterium]|nr:ABC transporter permease [Candidatus Hydrogenedentota bacterium]